MPATPAIRLAFLYPQFFRAPLLGETASQAVHLTCRRKPPGRPLPSTRCHQGACFATATSPKQATFPAARHGKAVEPTPLGDGAQSPTTSSTPSPSSKPAPTSESEPQTRKQKPPSQPSEPAAAEDLKGATATVESAVPPDGSNALPRVIELGEPTTPPPSAQEPGTPAPEGREAKKHASGPMDAILHMKSPQNGGLPHLSPPPYVHHFDTYSLVKQLEEGGYTREQSITIMKAVRALLAQNLDVAQAGLLSRRDMDNETYLFRAACSELSTEVKNNRRIADEQLRQQRTHVQHEVDISTQSLNQELLTLNDNVKGMFNDRRMAVREEQKGNESAIQQINYKISVMLTSDAKASIEAMRWILIRRGILGLFVMVVLTIATLRYGAYLSHEKQERTKKLAQEAEELRKSDGRTDRSPAPDAAEILAAN